MSHGVTRLLAKQVDEVTSRIKTVSRKRLQLLNKPKNPLSL